MTSLWIDRRKTILDQAACWPLAAWASPQASDRPHFLSVVWQDQLDETVHLSRFPGRQLGQFLVEELDMNHMEIPFDHFLPKCQPQFTRCDKLQAPSSSTAFFKTPRLVAYDGTGKIAQRLHDEILVLEEIHRNPHPGILEYHGCRVDDVSELVTGVCVERYPATLRTFLDHPVSLEW